MQAREWLLTAAVIVIPLIIAVSVTLWSLEQARYRPKRRRPTRPAPVTTPDGEVARSETNAVNGQRP